MKAIRLTLTDTEIVNYIVGNLLDATDTPASPEHLSGLLADERSYLIAVLDAAEVIGFALAYRFPSLYASENMAYLYDIEVVAAHRRRGIGRLLIATLKDLLEKDDVGELWLGTGVDNVAGKALFSRTGAAQSDETFYDYTYEL